MPTLAGDRRMLPDGVAETLQNAVATAVNGTAIDMDGYRRLCVQVTIVATITVNFEGSVDGGATYFAMGMISAADGVTVASTAAASGVFFMPWGMALSNFRARTSGPSGTPTATVKSWKTQS